MNFGTNKTFHLFSGLPRSGSTVLSSLLNQHPDVYVTPTSPLLDQIVECQKIWENLQTVKANPVPEQLNNICSQMIINMWRHIDKPIIIDRNRGWGKNEHPARILFKNPNIKMIATVRDIPSIMASWLTLLRQNENNHIDRVLAQRGYPVDDEHRLGEMWFNMVKDCVESLLQAKNTFRDRLLIVEYDDLIKNPIDCLKSIENHLKIIPFEYDINNIKSNDKDEDMQAWGLNGMHSVRKNLTKISKDPRMILGDMMFERFEMIERGYNEDFNNGAFGIR